MLLRDGRAPGPVDLRLAGDRAVEAAPGAHRPSSEPVLDRGGRFVRRGHCGPWAG